MPINLIFVILFLIATLIARAVWKSWAKEPSVTRNDGYGRTQVQRPVEVMRWATYALAAITLLLFISSCTTIVGTKKEGVVTSFGKPVGTMDNGIHFKAPWQSVHELDAAIQTDTDEYTVRLANGSIATVDASIRWRIVPDAADDLYRDYKEFDHVRDSLVTRQLNAALNEVFATYDPLASLAQNSNTDQGKAVEALGEQVQAALERKVDAQIEVLDVLTPRADFDESTEDKITQFQQALADTRIAEQRKQTAAQEADANRILKESVSNDPNVLVSKCLDLIKAGADLPAGFQCWQGAGGSVVIPSK